MELGPKSDRAVSRYVVTERSLGKIEFWYHSNDQPLLR